MWLNSLIPTAEGKMNEEHLDGRFSPSQTSRFGTASFHNMAHTSVAPDPKGFSELKESCNITKCGPSA